MTFDQQHRRWRADVGGVVRHLEALFPGIECVTYVDHPWPGWDNRSIDVWQHAKTWTPADLATLRAVRRHVMQMPGAPFLRHTILRHQLWTSFGGYSRWAANDHKGRLLHLHLTYW